MKWTLDHKILDDKIGQVWLIRKSNKSDVLCILHIGMVASGMNSRSQGPR